MMRNETAAAWPRRWPFGADGKVKADIELPPFGDQQRL